MRNIEEGALAVAYWEGGKSPPFTVEKMARISGTGVLNMEPVLGKPYGSILEVGNRALAIVAASHADIADSMARGAQIITPKDIPRMLWLANIGPGSVVIEAGAGSGSLSMALCRAVSPGGKVYTYDIDKKNLELAKRNISRAQLSSAWVPVEGNIESDVKEKDADAIFLDVPQAAEAIPAAARALRPGGYLVGYCPTVPQLEGLARAMRSHGFVELRLLEIIEREWVVHSRGSRPDHAKLGHTGFICAGRFLSTTFKL